LTQGIWEVEIAKASITEPLDDGWEKSSINVPSPGTIASYRKGVYHAHETATEWRVHLDHYDPRIHPVRHLIDDAPLILMIGDTFKTLLMNTRARNTAEMLREQKTTWRMLVVLGVSLVLVALFIGLDPFGFFEEVILFLLPLMVTSLGMYMIWEGLGIRHPGALSGRGIILGIGIMAIGIFMFYLPTKVMAGIILLILALWSFSSGIVSIKRVAKGRLAVPEGFLKILALGLLSLSMAIAIFLAPQAVLVILIDVMAVIAFLLGLLLIGDGLSLRRRMKHTQED